MPKIGDLGLGQDSDLVLTIRGEGGLWFMVARERGGDISPGVPTNCRLALLLWTFNNNKSQPAQPSKAIFTFYLPEKMCSLPSSARSHLYIFRFPPNAVHLLNDFIKERELFLWKASSIIEEGADLIHF